MNVCRPDYPFELRRRRSCRRSLDNVDDDDETTAQAPHAHTRTLDHGLGQHKYAKHEHDELGAALLSNSVFVFCSWALPANVDFWRCAHCGGVVLVYILWRKALSLELADTHKHTRAQTHRHTDTHTPLGQRRDTACHVARYWYWYCGFPQCSHTHTHASSLVFRGARNR